MSIRTLAAAAKEAEEAAQKAERLRVRTFNARLGEVTVYDLLGVQGTAVRANPAAEETAGAGTIVKLEDDLFVKVWTANIYPPRGTYFGHPEPIGTNVYLKLCSDKGITLSGTMDIEIKSLADLHVALTARDKYLARKA